MNKLKEELIKYLADLNNCPLYEVEDLLVEGWFPPNWVWGDAIKLFPPSELKQRQAR